MWHRTEFDLTCIWNDHSPHSLRPGHCRTIASSVILRSKFEWQVLRMLGSHADLPLVICSLDQLPSQANLPFFPVQSLTPTEVIEGFISLEVDSETGPCRHNENRTSQFEPRFLQNDRLPESLESDLNKECPLLGFTCGDSLRISDPGVCMPFKRDHKFTPPHASF